MPRPARGRTARRPTPRRLLAGRGEGLANLGSTSAWSSTHPRPSVGFKQSGLGREGTPDAHREFQEEQYLSVAWPS